MGKAARYLLLGQLSLFGFLLICFLLIPHFLLEPNEGGVSNYGLYAKTVVPYTLAFGLCGLLTLSSARFIRRQGVKRVVAWLGGLFIVVLVSTYPYKTGPVFGDIHEYAGVALLVSEMAAGIWFAMFLARNVGNVILLLAEALGFALAVMNYFGLIHVLFIAESVASLGFGSLLVRTINTLSDIPIVAK